VADGEDRDPWRGDAADVQPRRVHLELDEQLRDREAELRRAAEERPAARRADRVAVRAAAGGRGGQHLARDPQPAHEPARAGEADPLVAPRAARLGGEQPVGARHGDHGIGRADGDQPVEAGRAERAQDARVAQLAAVAAGDGACELHADADGVERRPRREVQIQQGDLARDERGVRARADDPGVDALRGVSVGPG